MALDTDRIDDATLALLCLGLHDGQRAWKSFDGDAMARLHEKGLISDPVGRTKSVAFTDEDLAKAQSLLRELFAKKPAPGRERSFIAVSAKGGLPMVPA